MDVRVVPSALGDISVEPLRDLLRSRPGVMTLRRRFDGFDDSVIMLRHSEASSAFAAIVLGILRLVPKLPIMMRGPT